MTTEHPKETYLALRAHFEALSKRYLELEKRYHDLAVETRRNIPGGNVGHGAVRFVCRAVFDDLDSPDLEKFRDLWLAELRHADALLELVHFRGKHNLIDHVEAFFDCTREALRVAEGSLLKMEEMIDELEFEDELEQAWLQVGSRSRFEHERRQERLREMGDAWRDIFDLLRDKWHLPVAIEAVVRKFRRDPGNY